MTSFQARLKSITGSLTEGRFTFLGLLLLLLLATGLRLYHLEYKSLHPDEIYTVSMSAQPLPFIWNNSLGNPMLYLLAHPIVQVGLDEFWLRLPMVFEGVLGVVLLYKVGEALFGRKEGVIAAFLLALSGYHIRYSQNFRFYPMQVLVSLLTLYLLWRALQERRYSLWIAFALASAANLYNHLYAGFVLATELLFASLVLLHRHLWGKEKSTLALRIRTRDTIWALLGPFLLFLLILILYWPQLLPLIRGIFDNPEFISRQVEIDYSARPYIFELSWRTFTPRWVLDRLLGEFGAGPGLALFPYVAASLCGLLASGRKRGFFLLIWMILPFAVLVPKGVRGFALRFVLFILPVYLLLVARGTATLARWAGRAFQRWGSSQKEMSEMAILTTLSLILAGFSLAWAQIQYEIYNDDWRGAVAYLEAKAEPGDLILFNNQWPLVELPYYSSPGFLENHLMGATAAVPPVAPRVAPLELRSEGGVSSGGQQLVIFTNPDAIRFDPPTGFYAVSTKLVERYSRYRRSFHLYRTCPEEKQFPLTGDRGQRTPYPITDHSAVWLVLKTSGPLPSAALSTLDQAFGLENVTYFANIYLVRVQTEDGVLEDFHTALYTLSQIVNPRLIDPNLFQSLAQAFEGCGQYSLANQARIAAGDTYLASDRAQEAVEEYEKALALDASLDQQAWFHVHLGKAYQKCGRREEAIREYERVLELEPDNAAARRALDALRQ